MKTCGICYQEFDGKDGENLCPECELIEKKDDKRFKAAKARRKANEEAYKSLGLVKVKGSLGGTYWE